MIKDIATITYTTSKYSDVWNMHFLQMSKHSSLIKSYAFSDAGSEILWNLADHQLVTYDNSDPYWKQYLGCLESIPENYVIYLQEDFILFSDVKFEEVVRYQNFLENSEYDYVRLIRCGYSTPLNRHVKDDIYEVDMATNDAFSMQATLWKKSSLQKLYAHVKSEKWLESEAWNSGARNCKIKGTFIYNNEPQVGAFHYDSKVWPYVCTAINRGKWNIDQYPEIMKNMFETYSVDPQVRGIRIR
jgi:hypothetical protein